MRLQNIIKTKTGLITILIIASVAGWIGTAFDETLMKDDIGTISLLLYESIVFLFVLGVVCLFSKTARDNVIENVGKMSIHRFLVMLGFSIFGLMVAIISDLLLQHHGTANLKMSSVIVSFLVTGSLFFLVESKNFNIKKLLFFIIMLGGAVGFNLVGDV